ncbi:lysylphosphatidylglycerol synthase transmembrane domain-containing protein [Tersicoccus sp. Bi-70]|uniref:lysylphosphatidylglycerol synthase transmembrane domain-containing protein n=1 Tax=Tersicoccus sp. Bi-70 TaxID=1897634 RepID=UPI0009773663|nr:lysylphosphatidylglycerol synthase transmembrane domain-containing protein [Tersicoccus sp. Bi-70]OMH36603.1 hypothetical protein BGP79_12315 [Tersicoccus sp. Bi-70]
MGPDGRGGPAAPGIPPPREAIPAGSREPSARTPLSARPLIVALQVTVTVGILVWVVAAWGPAPFIAATRVLTWPAVVAGLVLGALGILLQAHRWRLVAAAQGLRVSTSAAVARCWQAAFLNAVLPGGLAGDAVRAVEQPSRRADASSRPLRETLKRSVGAVAAERLAGTTVVLLAATVTLAPVHLGAALLCLAIAASTAAVASPWLRRLPRRTLGLVILLSVAGWAVFAAIFVVALLTVAPAVPLAQAPALAAISLAGMSVPLNVAGWGPREGAAALGFTLLGHPPAQGVAVSVAYGLLALVSVLPGAVVLLTRTLRSGRPHPARTSRTGPEDGPTIHPVAAAPSPQPAPSDHHRPRHAHRATQER